MNRLATIATQLFLISGVVYWIALPYLMNRKEKK